MRILYITLENLSFHKGSVIHVKEIISNLRKLGHHVDLAACSFNKSEIADRFYNLNVINFFPFTLLKLKKQPYLISSIILFLYLFKIILKQDFIYVREYSVVIIALLPRIIFKKKLVFEMNGIANEEQKLKGHSFLNLLLIFLIKKTEKWAVKNSDQIISVTPQIGSYLVTNFHYRPKKIEVIGNGVDIKKFYPIQDAVLLGQWKERLGIKEDEIIIAFVGNLARWQGVEILIESGLRLLAKGRKMKFLIVGDGTLKETLITKVNESNWGKGFIFTGMMNYENIPFLINLADICVAPFILRRNQMTGVSPIKVFEYMACGKPIVASKVEGLEFIDEEELGHLTDPEDVIGLEGALYNLIMEPQKRRDMGKRGFQIVRERFTWEAKASKIEKTLKELA